MVGIDGTIAGPSSVGGTVHSGAVVNFSDYAQERKAGDCSGTPNFRDCGADVVAYITAHEGGHWMGLYHTTEAIGGMYDPLSDTARCECSTACGISPSAQACCYDPATGGFAGTCSAGEPTLVTGATCSARTSTCGGADYLMFWLIHETSSGTFSPQQSAVVRANPVVQ